MVNCNPETVSTDYDTSDRLYFEPLDTESVLAICEREKPDGVVIQFGGQTPLKLARAIEDAGYRILGTPFDAVDLAEDRERFGGLLARTGSARRSGGSPRRRTRPSRSPSGSATRCSSGRRTCSAAARCASVTRADEVRDDAAVRAPILVDRFLEDAVEVDVDALCDGVDTYVAAVMQHVEEAGVHSGDSACVLPAPSSRSRRRTRSRASCGSSGAALGVVGLLNVQLAVTGDGEVYVLEANPRASRTVPFVSKATGVELVEVRVPPRARARRSRELGLPPERPPRQWSVKAAVLPFARFPGSDPVLGPEMRSTGEVMASAADLSTALAKAERAPGRAAAARTAPSSSRSATDDKSAVPIARDARRSRLRALRDRRARRATLAAAGIEVEPVREAQRGDGRRADGRRPHPPRPLRPRDQHAARAAARAPTATRSARRRSRRACRASRRSRARPRPCTRSRTRAPSRRVSLQERIDAD